MKKIAILGLVFLGIFVAVLFYIRFASNKVFVANTNSTQAGTSVDERLKSNTSFNILLLGYGGGNHDGAYLTDSMIVTHFDPKAKKMVLISIPRDIWIKIPTKGNDGSYWKINASYELGLDDIDYPNKQDRFKGLAGGGNLAKYIVETVTGLSIDRFIALDFNGFQNSIDTLGGVDINVDPAFDDYEYPIDGKEDDLCGHQASDLPDLEKISTVSATQAFPCRYEHLHFDSGMQHMDGATALKYVRSRHSLQDGTDFGRSKRQRNLIASVKQKIFAVGFIPKIIPFMSSLKDDFRTDLSPEELTGLINQANSLQKYSVSNIALTDQNVLASSFSDDGQYILTPKDSKDSWNVVHNFVQQSLDQSVSTYSPIIKVENATTIVGLGSLAANRLQDKDFNVLAPSNAQDQTLEKTTITVFNSNIDQKIIDSLKTEFGVSDVIRKQSNDLSYDILIEVGKDYNLKQGKKLLNN